MKWTGFLLALLLILVPQSFAGQSRSFDSSPAVGVSDSGPAYIYADATSPACGFSNLAGEEESAISLAQVQFGQYCCDDRGFRRCMLPAPAPIGLACYCNGIPGTGFICW